jgi:hypothetical protein
MRLYAVTFNAVAVVAAQDLFALTATASMAFKVHYIELGQKTLTSWEAKEIQLRYMPAVVTTGSGGAAATPRPLNPSDVAATVTARTNDTALTTSSGTAYDMLDRDWEFLNGFIWMPAPEQRPIVKPGAAIVLRLPTAPSASMSSSGTIVFEELF